MNQSMQSGADDALMRLANGFTRWVLGLGLLSLHASVYAITMVGLVLWNIYSSPGNIWVDEVFYRWTAVLAFHAIAVACGWTAWRLMRSEQAAVFAAQRDWSSAPTRPAELRTFAPRPETNGWQETAPAPAGAMQRYAETAHRADDAAKRALVRSAEWSSAFARRTAGALSTTAGRLTNRASHPAAGAAPDPTHTWPESPARHRPDDEEFISRFAGQAASEPTATVEEQESGADIVLNVTSGPGAPSGTTPHVGKEPGKSWVEAATFAWHEPHLSDVAEPEHRQNGHRAEPTTPDPPSS